MDLDLKELFELVAQMNSKLDKLDNIERYVVCVFETVLRIWRQSSRRGK